MFLPLEQKSQIGITGPYGDSMLTFQLVFQPGYTICMKVPVSTLCETAKETQMYRTVFWTLWERERVGWFGRMALKHVYYHVRIESPVYVQCRIQHAWGWCSGMIQRDDMAWKVGRGFRIGNSCTPVADSCQCMAKPPQYCKVNSLQLKYINF